MCLGWAVTTVGGGRKQAVLRCVHVHHHGTSIIGIGNYSFLIGLSRFKDLLKNVEKAGILL